MVSRLSEPGIVYINTSWDGVSYFFIPTASCALFQNLLWTETWLRFRGAAVALPKSPLRKSYGKALCLSYHHS